MRKSVPLNQTKRLENTKGRDSLDSIHIPNKNYCFKNVLIWLFYIPYFPLFGVNLFTILVDLFLIPVIFLFTPWTQDVNWTMKLYWTHVRRSEEVADVFGTPYVHSTYVLCSRGNQYQKIRKRKTTCLTHTKQKFKW